MSEIYNHYNDVIDISENRSFDIYPNPSNDFIYIKSINPAVQQFILSLYNLLGEKIFSDTFIDNYKLFIGNFSKGFYLIVISGNNGELTEKEDVIYLNKIFRFSQ